VGSEHSPPLLLVEGELVGLGPLRRDLVPTYQRWISSREVARGVGSTGVHTLESEQGWFERSSNNPAAAHFTIYDRADMTPVGTSALASIDHHQGTATFGILLGERRGRGLGTEATRLTLDWGFNVLDLHNVELRVWAWNQAAIAAYRKAGFREVGRLRGAHLSMGERYDVVIMDAVPEDLPRSVLRGGAVPPAR
jgi:diamine N-acetyltransferase